MIRLVTLHHYITYCIRTFYSYHKSRFQYPVYVTNLLLAISGVLCYDQIVLIALGKKRKTVQKCAIFPLVLNSKFTFSIYCLVCVRCRIHIHMYTYMCLCWYFLLLWNQASDILNGKRYVRKVILRSIKITNLSVSL